MLSVEQLFDLGERLDRADFKLAPHQFMSARYVLETLEARKLLPANRHELAPLLAPIFCTSAAEQQRFPGTYYAWLNERFRDVVPPSGKEAVIERPPPVVPTRWRLAWKPFAALLVLNLGAITAWGAYHNLRERLIVGQVSGPEPGSVSVRVDDGGPITPQADGRFRIATRAIDLPVNVTFSAPGFESQDRQLVGKDLADERRSLFMKGTNADRLDLGRIELAPTVPEGAAGESERVTLELPAGESTAPETIGPPTIIDLKPSLPGPPWSKQIIWRDAALTLVPIALFLLWQIWRATRRPVLQRLASRTPPMLREMQLPKGVASIYPSMPMRRLVQELRRRRLMHSAELQVDQTIAATLRNAGEFTPVLGSRVEPDYLALVDSTCLSDHQARFCNELVAELARCDVLIERYSFDRIPSLCERRDAKSAATRQSAASVPVDELQMRNPDHRVLLFTDGAGLFDTFTGAPAPCVASLLQWEAPYILTPKPLRFWGEMEWALENLGFRVLPLTRDGMLLLMSMLSGSPATHLARENANVDRVTPRYDRSKRRWLERSPPSKEEIERLCDALQNDLSDPADGCGDRGFAWLAACAVYPEIHWGLTLRIGAALVPDESMRERLLPRLTRLVWLRDAYMPDWMRQELLERLSAEDEERVRVLMHDILGMLSSAPGDDVPLLIAMPAPAVTGRWQALRARIRRAIETWRRRGRSEAVIRSADKDSPLRDYVFLRFISGQSVGKLSLTAPGTLLRVLFRSGSPFLGFRPLLIFLTALVATSALGVALGPLHTGRIYTPLVGISFSADGTVSAPFLNLRSPEGVDGIDSSDLVGSGVTFTSFRRTADRIESNTLARVTGDFDSYAEVSPDRTYLVYASLAQPDELVLQNLKTGGEVTRLQGATCDGFAKCARFSPNGDWLAYAGAGGGLAALQVRNSTRVPRFGEGNVMSLAFSPDEQQLAGAVEGANGSIDVVVWRFPGFGEPVARFAIGERVNRLEYTPDGQGIVVLLEKDLAVIDAASGARRMQRTLDASDLMNIAVDPGGTMLALVRLNDALDGRMMLIDLSSGATLEELQSPAGGAYVDVAFSTDGRRLGTAGLDGTVSFWDLPENYPARRAGRSLALVIANQYPTRAINPPSPVPAARDIATTLRERYGFGVTFLENASTAQMRDALAQLANIVQPADRLLVYFAGQGRESEVGPLDIRGVSSSYDDWLTGDEIIEALYAIRAGQILLVTGASRVGGLRAQGGSERAPVGSRELIASFSDDPGIEFGAAFGAALRAARSAHSSEWVFAETQRRIKNVKDPRSVIYERLSYLGDRPGNFTFPAPRDATPNAPVDMAVQNDTPAQATQTARANPRLQPTPRQENPPVQQTAPTQQAAPRPEKQPEQPAEPQSVPLEVTGDLRREGDVHMLEFGQVGVGSSGGPRVFRLENAGGAPVAVRSEIKGREYFTIDDGCAATKLGPKESCRVSISFAPREPGAREALFEFFQDSGRGRQILIRGTAIADAAAKPAPPTNVEVK